MTGAQKSRLVLVTGGAGFIGSHLVDCLLARGDRVVVLDNFDPYYDVTIKRKNIEAHRSNPRFQLVEGDIRSEDDLNRVFGGNQFDAVAHLAGLAGVRASLDNPGSYMDVNVVGTQQLISAMLNQPRLPHLVFGSSSSVYGARSAQSFHEDDRVDRPLSPYAASKIAAEAVCHAAHHTRGLNVVCLRFFTVFGPRQRPDLAIHKFCRLIETGETIDLYGDGTMLRDYTYVADIVSGVESALALDECGFEVINLGRSQPVALHEVVSNLEEALGRRAQIEQRPVPPGDVPHTFANIDKARDLLGYVPKTSFKDGIIKFVEWYRKEKLALSEAAE